MKTRTETKQRHAERDFDIAMMDCKSEFGIEFMGDEILDETEYALCVEEDE